MEYISIKFSNCCVAYRCDLYWRIRLAKLSKLYADNVSRAHPRCSEVCQKAPGDGAGEDIEPEVKTHCGYINKGKICWCFYCVVKAY